MSSEAVTAEASAPASGHPEHTAQRPTWDCRVCSAPWPCAPSKVTLLDDYRAYPSLLLLYLSAQMHACWEDYAACTGDVPPDLGERFMSWAMR
jgi:hypothetical protein